MPSKKVKITAKARSGLSLKIPASQKTYSSNWKVLAQKIQETDKTNHVRKARREQKRAKRLGFKEAVSLITPDDCNPPSVIPTVIAPPTSQPPGDVNGRIPKAYSIDCEFVGVGDGGVEHMLARVSVVDQSGGLVWDVFVKPQERVVDYRTAISGIRAVDLKSSNAQDFESVRLKVGELIDGHLLVGHSLQSDLKVLMITHPKRHIRDTASYKPFHSLANTTSPSLKKLALTILGIEIQQGEHDSITDAKVAMQLYQLHRKEWETRLKNSRKKKRNRRKVNKPRW